MNLERRRDRDDLFVGMRIRHKWSGREYPEFNWVATVQEINDSTNELQVSITSPTSGTWHENWNKAHTESGLRQMEYLEVDRER